MIIMNIRNLTVPVVLGLSLLFVGCGDTTTIKAPEGTQGLDGQIQEGIEGVEQGAEDATGAVKDGMDSLQQGAEDGLKGLQKGTEDATGAVQDGMDNLQQEAENATDDLGNTLSEPEAKE